MNRHLSSVTVAVLAAAVQFTAPALADHRPGNVVVMGGSWALSGGYAEAARGMLIGRKLFVDELNARGGLLGHRVELRILDDNSDRRTAIELYERLITENKIDLLLAPYSSSINDAVANVTERYKRPFIITGNSPVIFQRGRRYVFRPPLVIAQDYQKGPLYLAAQLGVKRIAIIGEGSLFPRQVTEGAMEWARKLGLEVVLLVSYRKERTDFTALLRRIEASGAEAILSNGYYFDAVAQIRQLRELDINVKLFSATLGPGTPKFVKELGNTAEYVVGFSQWEPKPHLLGHPGMKELIEHYEKRFGEKPNYRVPRGYTEIQINEAAVKEAGSFDPEKVRDALASITVQTVMGPYQVDEHGFMSTDGLAIQIQNGKRVIVWPPHLAEARFLPMPKWADRAKK